MTETHPGGAPVTALVAAGDDVARVAERWGLTREAVLVACWYQAMYQRGRWRKRWRQWARDQHHAMWEGRWADVDDPPAWWTQEPV